MQPLDTSSFMNSQLASQTKRYGPSGSRTRPKVVVVRMTKQEEKNGKANAKKAKMTFAAYIRMRVCE